MGNSCQTICYWLAQLLQWEHRTWYIDLPHDSCGNKWKDWWSRQNKLLSKPEHQSFLFVHDSNLDDVWPRSEHRAGRTSCPLRADSCCIATGSSELFPSRETCTCTWMFIESPVLPWWSLIISRFYCSHLEVTWEDIFMAKKGAKVFWDQLQCLKDGDKTKGWLKGTNQKTN